MPTLLFVVNDLPFFLSHRLPIASAAVMRGYAVHLAAPAGDAAILASLGIRFHSIRLRRGAPSLLTEIQGFWDIWSVMHRTKPDIVHLVTSKPVIYGGICARLQSVPGVVAAISGLGHIYTGTGIKVKAIRNLVSAMYRAALGHARSHVIFQNDDDRSLFVQLGVIGNEQAYLFRGSGVDLDEYAALPEPEGVPRVLFPARLLGDKGIREFVAAVRQIRGRGIDATFAVAGDPDPANPTSIANEELLSWKSSTDIEFLGHCKSMAVQIQASNIVCLPSYREGLPKSLVEAAACGRAVVTTDVPGCRDAIIQGETGLLVPVGSISTLVEALCQLIIDRSLRNRFGTKGRMLAEREFAIGKIVRQHLDLYASMSGTRPAGGCRTEEEAVLSAPSVGGGIDGK